MWNSSTYSDDARDKSARKLVDLVYKVSDGTYRIEGKPYVITLTNCSCDDFVRQQRPCKHIRAVTMKLARMEFIAEGIKIIELPKEGNEFEPLIKFMRTNGETLSKMILYDNFDTLVDIAEEKGIIIDTGKTFTLMR